MQDLEAYLAPISEDAPTGEDMAFSTEFDLIQEARREDDPTLEQGDWVVELKTADWHKVLELTGNILQQRSKDLRVAGWWCEGSAKLQGLAGLAQGLNLVAALCSRYWDTLHPQAQEPDNDMEERVGNLTWLLSSAGQWLRNAKLGQSSEGSFSLLDLEIARGSGERSDEVMSLADIENIRRNTPLEFYSELLQSLELARHGLEALQATVDSQLGADGPGFAALREQLEEVEHAARRYARDAGVLDAAGAGIDDTDTAAQTQDADDRATRAAPGVLATRKQAIEQLRQVADFFRSTEPHSPVAYLADKAARWGEMPLHVWLQRVIKDESTLSQMQEMLDVLPPSEQ